jgi:ribosomal-protein-alanine N-acetyltransferase
MIIFAETDRTILREMIIEDVDDFYEMDSDPEVHRFLGTKPVTDKNEIADTIRYVRQQYFDHGIGRWAIVDKSTGQFIGWTGLKLVKDMINLRTNYYDLGYRLKRKHWGQGFATETAIASLDYGFDILKLNEIIATVNMGNAASNRVVNKLGFTLSGTFNLHDLKHNWYTIDKEEWDGVRRHLI